MKKAKFTLNAFIIVVICFSALLFSFMSAANDAVTSYIAINDRYPIEGTELAVRYSNLKANGIYSGLENTDVLELEGDFGHDWALVRSGSTLYTNEYRTSTIGLMFSDLVSIDTGSFEKTVMYENTVLRGQCASGELVCVSGVMMSSDYPLTNPLCKLFCMTDRSLDPAGRNAVVLFIDPKTGETVYSVIDRDALTEDIEERYLSKTLEEVMK